MKAAISSKKRPSESKIFQTAFSLKKNNELKNNPVEFRRKNLVFTIGAIMFRKAATG